MVKRASRVRTAIRVAILLACAVLGGTLVRARADPPDPNPALQLHLDTVAGDGTTPDSSANGLTAHVTGSLGAGRWGQALAPANDGDGVRVDDNAALKPGSLTLVAWVKRSATPGANRIIVGKQGLIPETGEVPCAGYSYALVTGPSGGLRFTLRTDQGTDVRSETPELSSTAAWDGNWHMIAGTWNGNSMQLWVDGQAKGSPTSVGSFPILQGDGDTYPAALFGGYADHGAVTSCDASGARYTGGLDEVRLYPRALSSDEMAYLARGDLTSPPDLANRQPTPTPTPQPTPTPTPQPPSIRIQSLGLDVLHATGAPGNAPILWDLNGDGKPDVTCPANLPYLRLTPNANLTLRVSVTSGGGQSPPTTVQLTGLGVPKADQSLGAESAVCGASLTFFVPPANTPQTCKQATVSFGLAEVRGCFDQLGSIDKIDPAVRAVMKAHYDSVALPDWVVNICRLSSPAAKQVCAEDTKEYVGVDVYQSYGPIKLNGITINPRGAVVVAPNLQRIVSDDASLSWGGLTVQGRQAVDFNLAATQKVLTLRGSHFRPSGHAPIISFDAKRDLPDIGGFKLDGQADLSIEDTGTVRRSYARISVRLPNVFSLFGGQPPSASTTVVATNDSPPNLGTVDISVPEADIGPLKFTRVSFHYNADGDSASGCPRKYWKATAALQLPGTSNGPGAGFSLAPPPQDNGVAFCAGSFKGAGATITFGEPIPPPQIFPGVFLNSIHFGLQLDPLVFSGGAGLSAAGLVHIDGTLLAAFPTPSKPYQLTPQNAGALARFAPRTLTTATFGVGGEVYLKLPIVGETKIGSGGVLYSAPDDLSIGGNVRLEEPGFTLYGSVGGEMMISRGLFQFYGGIQACIADISIACLGAGGWVGSVGMVACVTIGPWNPGAGYRWGDSSPRVFFGAFGDGCKPSRYWTVFPSHAPLAARAAARGSLTFMLARGETSKSVRIGGIGGAPKVLVRAPGGETLIADGTTFQHSRTIASVREPETDSIYLDVVHGRAGTYTVTALPGSASLNGLSATRAGYDTSFRARVTGRGARRVLVYDARRKGGQRVRFFEKGPTTFHLIGSSTGGDGRIRFTPKPGHGGVRSILAVATLDGTPIPDQTLTHFRVATTPNAGRPARVTLRRKGSALVVRWTGASGAARYGVVLKGTGGTLRVFTRGPRSRALVVHGFPATQGVQATVTAQNVLGAWGRPRSSRALRALRKPLTVLQTGSKTKKKPKKPKKH